MKVSVVLAVFNEERHLGSTVESLLRQTESDFELVIVDDGSTDGTPEILKHYERMDTRIRVLRQPNRGLTRALISGCSAARADVIARQDSGDLSHPDRLRRQLALLDDDVVLVGCTTEFVGPEGEPLYVARVDAEETRRTLLEASAERLHSLSAHGSAMFRRSAYIQAGGYREHFHLAQDLDLFVRLAALGRIAADAGEPLYQMRITPGSLTSMNHDLQVRLKEIIVAVRDGNPTHLMAADELRPRSRRTRRALAHGYYFIGRCLRRNRDARANRYLRSAILHDPLHFRAWLSLLTGR